MRLTVHDGRVPDANDSFGTANQGWGADDAWAAIAARRPSLSRPPDVNTGSRWGPNAFHASLNHERVLRETFLRYFRSSTNAVKGGILVTALAVVPM